MVEDPVKTLENLGSLADEGCLLGMTIWGDQAQSNLITLAGRGANELGLPTPNVRSNFHLFNRIQEIADQSGWELVIQWEQNAPFPFYEHNENLKTLSKDFSGNREILTNYISKKIDETFAEKKTLNFPTQMAVLRKK